MAPPASRLLGTLCEVTAGPSGTVLDDLQDGPHGVPVISPRDMTDQRTVSSRHLRRLPQERAFKLARFAVRAGDILIVRQGALGKLALVQEEQAEWLYNTSCLRIRCQSEFVLPEYLVAYLAHPPVQEELVSRASPGTVPFLNARLLNKLRVILPSVERQRAIIDTLADIDEQIAIQRAMIGRLGALRPAVFGEMIQGSECP